MKEELLKSDRHTRLSMLIKHLVTFFLIEQIKPNIVFCSGEPLIFIEVALMKDVAATIQVKVLTLSSLTLSLLTSIKDSNHCRRSYGTILQFLNMRLLVQFFTLFRQLRYIDHRRFEELYISKGNV